MLQLHAEFPCKALEAIYLFIFIFFEKKENKTESN